MARLKKGCIGVIGLLIILALTVGGCGSNSQSSGNVDPVVQKVIDDIAALGEITFDDGEAIGKLENLYATLTDEQKKQVSNYIDLINAREAFDALEPAVSEGLALQRTFYPVIGNAVEILKDNLVNPSSLELVEIIIGYHYDEKEYTDVNDESKTYNNTDVFIHYRASNKVGGLLDGYARIFNTATTHYKKVNGDAVSYKEVEWDFQEKDSSWYQDEMNFATGKHALHPYEVVDGVYADTQTLEKDKSTIFTLINVEDYINSEK